MTQGMPYEHPQYFNSAWNSKLNPSIQVFILGLGQTHFHLNNNGNTQTSKINTTFYSLQKHQKN
jgi:hypothetical protein